MKLIHTLSALLFPPKCVLCGKLLSGEETDLCHDCRCSIQEFPKPHIKLPYLAQWTALWYYEGNVRRSMLRFKFRGARSHAQTYGRLLAMKFSPRELSLIFSPGFPSADCVNGAEDTIKCS